MAITFSEGTVTVSYTATQAQMLKVLANAAEHLYPKYPVMSEETPMTRVPFADLTNTQKLAIIDQHVKKIIMDAAKTNKENAAIRAARVTAAADDQTIS